jgi:DNA-binding NarL/FixJ family response regulator
MRSSAGRSTLDCFKGQSVIRTLLADSHRLLHPGIDAILTPAENIDLIATAMSGDELQQLCCERRPDVVLLGLNVFDLPCLEVLNTLQEQCPATNILLLLSQPDEICLWQMLEHGVAGAILKSDTPERLLEAIETVVEGENWFSSEAGNDNTDRRRGRGNQTPDNSMRIIGYSVPSSRR